jgi:hypothetical protein
MNGIPYKQTDEFVYEELTSFDALVMPWVPGVPAPMYQLQRISMIREFCRRTGAMIGLLPGIKIFDGQSRYTIEGVEDLMDVLTLKRLYFAENETPVNEAAYLMDVDRTSFALQAAWDGSYAEDVLIPLASLTVCRTAERIEANFFDRWADGITAGIISSILAIPRKSWTDPAAAAGFRGKFDQAVSNAKIAVSRDFDKYAPRTVSRSFE